MLQTHNPCHQLCWPWHWSWVLCPQCRGSWSWGYWTRYCWCTPRPLMIFLTKQWRMEKKDFLCWNKTFQSRHGLRTSHQCCSGLIVVEGQRWKTTFGSELGAAKHRGSGGWGWDHESVRICWTDPPVLVEATGHPWWVGNTLPGKLCHQIKEVPACVLRQITLGSRYNVRDKNKTLM